MNWIASGLCYATMATQKTSTPIPPKKIVQFLEHMKEAPQK